VFEYLIEEAHAIASKDKDWDEAAFQRARMDEKIQILGAFLPDFLVENRGLYKILSTGIHSLSEEDCLKAFPVVKVGIELILDAKLEVLARQKKTEAARKSISGTVSDVKAQKT